MAIRIGLLVAAVHAAFRAQVERVDSLNVYPVPDGDTGTNMLLTLESVLKETSDEDYESPEAASRAGARAALLGARGNSGVILSQMIRGACEVLANRASLTAETFASALEGAREKAYSSLREPVEGTMLTVIKDAAGAARAATEKEGDDLAGVVRAAVKEAYASVRRTPELLKVLRDAGVVDAGGLGVAVILEAVYASLIGDKLQDIVDTGIDGLTTGQALPSGETSHTEEEAWGYCTEFIVTGFEGDPGNFGEHIHEIGRSVLVIPDDDLVKVHLHTQDPGEALSYAGGFGRLSGIKVDDMEAQVETRLNSRTQTTDGSQTAGSAADGPAARVGVVAASRGKGSRELFESAGAVVIEGGQGKNPSVEDFVRAIEKMDVPEVILLPNNKNITPTAESVGEVVEARVHVISTSSIAGGLATMVGFDTETEPERVVADMHEISDSLRYGEVTCAVRDSRVEEFEVTAGSYIGFVDGKLCAVESGVEEAAVRVVGGLLEKGADILTLLRGEGLDKEAAGRIAAAAESFNEDVEVEVVDGGQPMYPLQMVAE